MLLYYLDTNSDLYKSLGFDDAESKIMNYYNKDQSGSFSIKKTLPLFSNLSYKDLDVHNGSEALAVYSCYNKMTSEELEKTKKALIEYCKQDTWAMVEILRGLRALVK